MIFRPGNVLNTKTLRAWNYVCQRVFKVWLLSNWHENHIRFMTNLLNGFLSSFFYNQHSIKVSRWGKYLNEHIWVNRFHIRIFLDNFYWERQILFLIFYWGHYTELTRRSRLDLEKWNMNIHMTAKWNISKL